MGLFPKREKELDNPLDKYLGKRILFERTDAIIQRCHKSDHSSTTPGAVSMHEGTVKAVAKNCVLVHSLSLTNGWHHVIENTWYSDNIVGRIKILDILP